MTPLQRYQQDLLRDDFVYDQAQALAVEQLEALYQRLTASKTSSTLFANLRSKWLLEKKVPEKGLYFWGGVGRGKTYLVDIFYESLPFENKMRVHFHRFMQRIHKELGKVAGKKNPIQLVANVLAEETCILCFDEFFVSDITDAMILGGLIKALFARGVTLVATSNIPPYDLYKNGLQRARFLPAITLIEQYTQVYEIDGGIDHRLRLLEQANLYCYPEDEQAERTLQYFFRSLMVDEKQLREKVFIQVLGRSFLARYEAGDVAWFDFSELCDGPRSQYDYIELAREYHAVIVSNVPQMSKDLDDQARRFISLVDEFYDRNVKLILSAQVPLLNLYVDGMLNFEFQRTLSRLQEMQSKQYLERAHQA